VEEEEEEEEEEEREREKEAFIFDKQYIILRNLREEL
jgi:hypothetical protein